MKATKQIANKGLVLGDFFNIPIESNVIVVDYSYAMRHDKFKTAKLEGEYVIKKVSHYNTKTDVYVLLQDNNGKFFTMIGEHDFISGLKTI